MQVVRIKILIKETPQCSREVDSIIYCTSGGTMYIYYASGGIMCNIPNQELIEFSLFHQKAVTQTGLWCCPTPEGTILRTEQALQWSM